jgi:ABC transport system ATP-binding/permease protein
VVVVSHDRYFLNRICDGILAFEGNEEIYFSEGDYDYYIQKRNTRLKEDEPEKIKLKKEDTREKPKARKLSFNEAKELEQIEGNITAAEGEVHEIEKNFYLSRFL